MLILHWQSNCENIRWRPKLSVVRRDSETESVEFPFGCSCKKTLPTVWTISSANMRLGVAFSVYLYSLHLLFG